MSLKTDYKDAMFPNRRKYQMIQNDDGTVSFEDVTEYTQEGDSFGAKDINETNTEVEMKFDSDDVVDPAVATQTGFAADAKATGDALKSQNSKIQTIEQSFRAGCNTIVSGCTTYGSTPASNSPADIVTSIKNIYTNRYNSGHSAGYSSGRTQGRNDVKNNPGAYGITVAPKSLSGSPTKSFGAGQSMDWVITFSSAFTTTPTINASARGYNWPSEVSYNVTTKSKAGFTVHVWNQAGQSQTIALDWNAVV